MYCITKWCKAVTDSGKDEYTGRLSHMREKLIKKVGYCPVLYSFRLLDDDGEIYCYGRSTDNSTELAFAPLDKYGPLYGCTEIQYFNFQKGYYETL